MDLGPHHSVAPVNGAILVAVFKLALRVAASILFLRGEGPRPMASAGENGLLLLRGVLGPHLDCAAVTGQGCTGQDYREQFHEGLQGTVP